MNCTHVIVDVLALTNSRECEGTLGGGPLEKKVCKLYSR